MYPVFKPYIRLHSATLVALLSLFLLPLMSFASHQQETAVSTPDRAVYTWHPERDEADLIEVKFAVGSGVRLNNRQLTSLNRSLSTAWSAELDQVAQLSDGGIWSRSFDQSESELTALRQAAISSSARSGGAVNSLPDLNLYYRLRLPEGLSPVDMLAELEALSIIEAAYPVQKPVMPPLPPDYQESNDENADLTFGNMYQRYLDAAPDGIDARYAWTDEINGRGDGIKICDVEYGYFDHDDLPNFTVLGPAFDNSLGDLFYDHGTAVMGVLGAKDNDYGITGIAYEADFFFASTYTNGSLNIAQAITRCSNTLNAGDVILIEQQASGPGGACQNGGNNPDNCVPVEWIKANYDAIKLAVAKGIIVVEAAGNGNEDLDDPIYDTGHKPFKPLEDSGAYIIGSANSAYSPQPRERRGSSTYGSTVDFYAWGHHIIAPGYGTYYNSDGDELSYTLFGGTSGASPLVAASAAILQANYQKKNGNYATPAQMKNLMAANGTAQSNESGENIGVMPDLKRALTDIWGEGPDAPVITPPSGTYAMPMTVTIDYGSSSQSDSNTHIRYTLNGTEPTFDSFIYIPENGDSIYLNYGVTLKAKAFQSPTPGGRPLESDTASVTYISSTPKVATPIITPNGGTLNQGSQIVLSTTTPGATIRYRTDGRTPSFFYPGTEYTGPLTLSPGTYEITARGYKDGYYKSDTAYSDPITINALQLPTPTLYPNGGQYSGEVNVYMGSTVLGAEIRYTLDGSTPNANSPLFDSPIVLNETTTVKARIYLDPYAPSEVVERLYTVVQAAAEPTISPPSGTTANTSLLVTLSTSTSGANIRYTTNGAEPTSYSTLYSGPITLNIGQHTIKAKSFLPGADPSESITADYTVYNIDDLISPVTIDPPGGQFNGPVTVSLATDTEDVDLIFYTLDGTDPQSPPQGTQVFSYDGPFELEASQDSYFIRVRAFKNGVGNSNMSAATLVIVDPQLGPPSDPTISPPSGTYTNTIEVEVTATDWSAPFNIRRLFVTDDGTEPTADFASPILGVQGVHDFDVETATTVKALVGQAGWFDSGVVTREYLFECEAPTVTSSGTYTTSVEVSMSTGTQQSDIYYTTDGSQPSDASTAYTGPVTLGVGEHVVRAICYRDGFDPSDDVTAAYVVDPTPVPPTFTTQPTDETANQCGSVTLSALATGTPNPTYQWYKDGDIVAGEIEPDLELPLLRLADAGTYTLVATNTAGETTSNGAVLTVVDGEETCFDELPSITVQPQSVTVNKCAAANFSVTATGTAPLSYQWYRDNIALTGETGATLLLDPVELTMAGAYTVVVANRAGSVTSLEATLTVIDTGLPCGVTSPAITQQPVSQTVDRCGSVTFSVAATGTAPLSYQWSKDGSPLTGQAGRDLILSDIELSDAGEYTVEVSNEAGSVTSGGAQLTVSETGQACSATGPEITQQPAGMTVNLCEPFSLSVAASGTAPFSYQWAKDGQTLQAATFATYSISEAESTDAGSYTVTITNGVGSVTSSPAVVVVTDDESACGSEPPSGDSAIFMPLIMRE